MTEFQSRRELRDAERNGLIPKPEQIFDLPTGQISLPSQPNSVDAVTTDLSSASEILTRRRIREMERLGLLDPLTGALKVPEQGSVENEAPSRSYDEVLAETEEPITSSIGLVAPAPAIPVENAVATPVATSAAMPAAPVQPTDIFHSMVAEKRTPKLGLAIVGILVLIAGAGIGAYTLGIFK